MGRSFFKHINCAINHVTFWITNICIQNKKKSKINGLRKKWYICDLPYVEEIRLNVAYNVFGRGQP